MPRQDQVEGFILTGGESSRMGRDKALLELGGESLLMRTARLIEPLVARVAVVGPPDQYAQLGFLCIADERPHGTGPLGGISTALKRSSSEWNLVLACDLPYLTEPWLDFLIHRALECDAEALIPQTERGPEPLCAMYRTRCGPTVSSAIERGVRKITEGLAGLAVQFVSPAEWKAFDSTGRLFKNMNTLADYEEAHAYFEAATR